MIDPKRLDPDDLVPCTNYAEQIGRAASACGLVDEAGRFPRWVLACAGAAWGSVGWGYLEQGRIERALRRALSTGGVIDAIRALLASDNRIALEAYLLSIGAIEPSGKTEARARPLPRNPRADPMKTDGSTDLGEPLPSDDELEAIPASSWLVPVLLLAGIAVSFGKKLNHPRAKTWAYVEKELVGVLIRTRSDRVAARTTRTFSRDPEHRAAILALSAAHPRTYPRDDISSPPEGDEEFSEALEALLRSIEKDPIANPERAR